MLEPVIALLALATLTVVPVADAGQHPDNPATGGTGAGRSGPAEPTEREILEVFFGAAGGVDWVNSTGWLTEALLSEWFGVAIDDEGRVTAIELAGNGLGGEIAPELGDLERLATLDLSANALHGGIPV